MNTSTDWIKNEIATAVRDLLSVHWTELDRALMESENQITVTFSAKINRQGPRPAVITRISFATRCVDERQNIMPDDGQLKLDMDKDVTMTAELHP